MITRIVKMTFRKEETEAFEKLFQERKDNIAAFDGCQGVELLAETTPSPKGSVYFTRSIWMNEESLNNYRKSELFKDTWTKTKALFADKPKAWSTKIVESKFE